MIIFALSSPNDAFTVIFINENVKDVDFKCSVVAQLGMIYPLGCYICLTKPCGQSESSLKSRISCASFWSEAICVCTYVLMYLRVCVSAEWWE